MNLLLRYLPYASAVGDAVASAINGVTEDIKAIATAIFGVLSLVGAIIFVIKIIMELIESRQKGEFDWQTLVKMGIGIILCLGGSGLAFTIAGAA